MTEALDTAAAFADIRAFLIEAGTFARQKQKGVKTFFKDGEQAVTETDLAISRLAQERLGKWLKRDGHILLDEESIAQAGTPAQVFAQTRYQWILDPIDGTAGYALGRRMWGISLGLWEQGRPLMGGIYLPVQRALLLCDGKRAWQVEEFGTPEETESEIRAVPMPLNSQVFVESYKTATLGWNKDYRNYRLWVNTPESPVQSFYSVFTQQAAAATTLSTYSIWDIAAAAAIARCSGFEMRTMKDATLKETYGTGDFADSWKLNETSLLGLPESFAFIRDVLMGA